jgi:predicted enzyme related to lactoylglutathione lyase
MLGASTAARTSEEGHMGNPVTHFEIHGRDGKKTQAFYASLFGWTVDANNPMDYGMVAAPDGRGIGGGITKAHQEPMVTVYVEVEDLDATLEAAESLGGKTILPPSDVEGGPKLAMFADPDGNVIGLTQAGTM